MNNKQTSGSYPLDRFDLMPPDYTEKHHAHRATFLWVSVITALTAILASVNGLNYIEAARMRKAHLNLATKAAPINDLRAAVIKRQSDLGNMRRCLDLAGSTRPDDSAVQLIGVIGKVAQQFAADIEIDKVIVRLPHELPVDKTSTDGSSITTDGDVAIHTFVSSLHHGRKFAVALSQESRFETVQYKIASEEAENGELLIIAKPRATKILP